MTTEHACSLLAILDKMYLSQNVWIYHRKNIHVNFLIAFRRVSNIFCKVHYLSLTIAYSPSLNSDALQLYIMDELFGLWEGINRNRIQCSLCKSHYPPQGIAWVVSSSPIYVIF